MPRENTLHLILLGRRNAGKSSLLNQLLGQQAAIVSPTPGTTTDPLKRALEIPGLATLLLIDTAGIDDTGTLGQQRVDKTLQAIPTADIAILLITGDTLHPLEAHLLRDLLRRDIPTLLLHNKSDLTPLSPALRRHLTDTYRVPVLDHHTLHPDPTPVIDALRPLLRPLLGTPPSLLGDIIRPADTILLVAPIDTEAPTGRLILPQVQTLRDILDNRAIAVTLQPEQLPAYLAAAPAPPRLVVTDSQAFHRVAAALPPDQPLTSFSILLARQKGNFPAYLRGTPAIDRLRDGDRVLILESCTHHATCDDIGRHKLPALLLRHTRRQLHLDFVPGLDALPRPVTDYSLLIQCGGCMVTPRQLRERLRPALQAGIPVTNYGMALAYLHGLFPRAILPLLPPSTPLPTRNQ